MGRSPCCAKEGMNRGAWTSLEDKILTDYIQINGQGRWRELPKKAGLNRCGKSCRLRWLNYLRPDIKRGNFTQDEDELIIKLHKLLGNRWSLIAGRLPGRTDNEIKNYWNTNLVKRTEGFSKPISRKKKQPSSETVTSQNVQSVKAVRTKAYRCTKAFITPQPENNARELMQHAVDLKSSPFSPVEDIYRPSFLPDIGVGEPCLADSGVYHQFSYFDKDVKQFPGSYKNTGSNDLSFDWRENGCSGFHSLFFLNPEEGWLRD